VVKEDLGTHQTPRKEFPVKGHRKCKGPGDIGGRTRWPGQLSGFWRKIHWKAKLEREPNVTTEATQAGSMVRPLIYGEKQTETMERLL
jgi:hypothetical protein